MKLYMKLATKITLNKEIVLQTSSLL